MAGAEGIEPPTTVLETVVMPLNYAPTSADQPLAKGQIVLINSNKSATLIQELWENEKRLACFASQGASKGI